MCNKNEQMNTTAKCSMMAIEITWINIKLFLLVEGVKGVTNGEPTLRLWL